MKIPDVFEAMRVRDPKTGIAFGGNGFLIPMEKEHWNAPCVATYLRHAFNWTMAIGGSAVSAGGRNSQFERTMATIALVRVVWHGPDGRRASMPQSVREDVNAAMRDGKLATHVAWDTYEGLGVLAMLDISLSDRDLNRGCLHERATRGAAKLLSDTLRGLNIPVAKEDGFIERLDQRGDVCKDEKTREVITDIKRANGLVLKPVFVGASLTLPDDSKYEYTLNDVPPLDARWLAKFAPIDSLSSLDSRLAGALGRFKSASERKFMKAELEALHAQALGDGSVMAPDAPALDKVFAAIDTIGEFKTWCQKTDELRIRSGLEPLGIRRIGDTDAEESLDGADTATVFIHGVRKMLDKGRIYLTTPTGGMPIGGNIPLPKLGWREVNDEGGKRLLPGEERYGWLDDRKGVIYLDRETLNRPFLEAGVNRTEALCIQAGDIGRALFDSGMLYQKNAGGMAVARKVDGRLRSVYIVKIETLFPDVA